jgi:hypothetical protein
MLFITCLYIVRHTVFVVHLKFKLRNTKEVQNEFRFSWKQLFFEVQFQNFNFYLNVPY